MAATVPNHDLDGFIKSMTEGVHGAFNKGVKYGRYLEQQERPNSVPHGDWKLIHIGVGHLWRCSHCDKDSLQAFDYCPNCGAKMDGGTA